MDKVVTKRFFSVFCVIFIFNSFFFSSIVYASSLPSLPSSSGEVDPDKFFWELLQNSLDRKIDIIDGKEFLLMPSEDFNSRLRDLVEQNFPFGGTPHLQNQYNSVPITVTSTPVAYIPFSYKSSQDTGDIHTSTKAFGVSSDKYSILNVSPDGFSSSQLSSSLDSHPAYAFIGNSSKVSLYGFASSDKAIFASGGSFINNISFSHTRFGVFECPFDDPSVFTPPTSSIPSGGDVYIPSGSSSFSDFFYKVDDDFYDIEGNPISDPFVSGGDSSSGSHGGKLEIDGKLDVNVSDINVNVNIGKGDGNSYEMPDTGFFESYLDDALEESSGIRKFIGDFFGTLPGQITQLICLAIVIAILCRIIGR